MSDARPHVQATIPDMLDLVVTTILNRSRDRFGNVAERTEIVLTREEVARFEALATRFLSPAVPHAEKIRKLIYGGR